MDKEKYEQAKSAAVAHLTNCGYGLNKLIYLCLQGSQNYNMDVYSDEYESDFDWKAFVLPSFEDLYYDNKVSKTLVYSYGQIEVKDIRLFPELLAKMNSSYVELLYSDYCVGKGWVGYLRSAADRLVAERKCLLVKTLMGMALEKQHALCHEYEGKKDVLEKFGGYDPKQLHHARRIMYMLKALAEGADHYGHVLWFDSSSGRRDELLKLKTEGTVSVEEAVKEMEDIIEQCRVYYNQFWDGKKPKEEISDNTLNGMRNYVFELVKDCLLG